MKPPAKFEFDILQHLAANPDSSVRELYDSFGKQQGIIRGTIVKTMDRLLKKGLVQRELIDGTYMYRAVQSAKDLDRDLVRDFVRDRLGGRLRPLLNYLAEDEGLGDKELQVLKKANEEVRERLDR